MFKEIEEIFKFCCDLMEGVMKLLEIKRIEGKIILKTGLHIGAGSDEIHIGGVDTPVVKDPLTNRPYIPGSSLKGKIRTILEWSTNRVDLEKGGPYATNDSNDNIARIFGNGRNEKDYSGGPTRVSFSDCFMNEEKAEEMLKRNALTEEKIEVSIDRVRGTVGGGGPRRIERVPAGAEFEFSISYKVFDMGDGGKEDEKNFNLLLMGMKLLEFDSLGGSGSRGYGKIRFEDVSINGESINFEEISVDKDTLNEFARQ